MATDRSYLFIAENRDLVLYNSKAVLNQVFTFEFDDGSTFLFSGYVSAYLYVYDSPERNYLVKSYTSQLSRNSNNIVMNASVSDMTFNESGQYYFELGFSQSGYEQPLRYGKLFIK